MLNLIFKALILILVTSCGSSVYVDLYNQKVVGEAKGIFIESSSDGEGVVISEIEVYENESLELFAIKRREDGSFEENIAVSWQLSGSAGTLTIASDGHAAIFNAQSMGNGKINILQDGVVIKTILINVLEVVNEIQNISVSNINTNSFKVNISTKADLKDNDSAIMYYCNNTKIPDCNPKLWYSLSMTKLQKGFELSSPTFKFPDDPKDEIKVLTAVTLNSTLEEQEVLVTLDGPKQIYRSIGVGSTTALVTRTSSGTNEASISDSYVSFESSVGDNIGIGDALVITYDSSGTPTQSIFFIRKRISSSEFLLNDSEGEIISTDYSNITNWEIYRAYTSVPETTDGSLTENVGIPIALGNFDTSGDAVADNKAWHFAFYADAVWTGTGKNNIESWKLSGNNFLRYFVPSLPTEVGVSQRHSGKWDATKATVFWTGSSIYNWPFMQRGSNKNAVRLEGFQFELDTDGNDNLYAFRFDDYNLSDGAYLVFSHNITRGVGATTGSSGSLSFNISNSTIKSYTFSNIAYNLLGTGISNEGPDSIVSHNTSVYNRLNFLGNSNGGVASFLANISFGGDAYEFRSSVSGTLSDYNIAADSSAPGPNSLDNSLLSEIDFYDPDPGVQDFCTSESSIANINGPRMIDESDPVKIYYDAAGKVRRPTDSKFPIGACTRESPSS